VLRPTTRARIRPPPSAPELTFFADLGQLCQVLINLLENAGDTGASTIDLSLGDGGQSPVGPMLRLDVSDNGPGVPSEVRGRVFDPFFTTKAHGTGLGLAIARDLARLNDGDLTLSSAGPGPTTFTLTLLRARASPRWEAP
jgi:signal transduction histidine kinase